MSELTQSPLCIKPPSDFYFGYSKGTMRIYHCSPNTTLHQLLQYIHSWLDAELGRQPKVFGRISIGSRTVFQMPICDRDRFEDVTQPIPESFYASETKTEALNLQAYSVFVADHFVGGDARLYPMLALVDGPGKQYIVTMRTVTKALPSDANLIDPDWQRLHSPDTTYLDWMKSLLSLQDAGLVRKESSAVWGSEERKGLVYHWDVDKIKKPASREHELRVVFIGLHVDVLTAAERFWQSLPASADQTAKEGETKSKEVEAEPVDIITGKE